MHDWTINLARRTSRGTWAHWFRIEKECTAEAEVQALINELRLAWPDRDAVDISVSFRRNEHHTRNDMVV